MRVYIFIKLLFVELLISYSCIVLYIYTHTFIYINIYIYIPVYILKYILNVDTVLMCNGYLELYYSRYTSIY